MVSTVLNFLGVTKKETDLYRFVLPKNPFVIVLLVPISIRCWTLVMSVLYLHLKFRTTVNKTEIWTLMKGRKGRKEGAGGGAGVSTTVTLISTLVPNYNTKI